MPSLTRFFLLILLLTSAACTTDSPHIIFMRINQVGYMSEEAKTAVIFSKGKINERILLMDKASERRIAAYEPVAVKAKGWGRFDYYKIDFSNIRKHGEYFLMAEKKGCRSQSFSISNQAYTAFPGKLLEFMRQQRCGYNPLLDIHCHQKDGKSMYGPLPDSSFVDVSGGWHDAGNLITGSYATAHMLKAYELFPEYFPDQVDDRGQPAPNGIPDVLDEAKWGLNWIHKLHPSPDLLIHQVAEATGVSNIAGRSAAAMAMAAIIWREVLDDQTFANKCLIAAKSLYQLGKENEGFQQGNSYGAPYRYREETWADDMEWAAAELYTATREENYLADAKRYAGIAGAVSWTQHDTAYHYQYYPFVNIGHFALYDKAGESQREVLAGYYKQGIDHCIERAGNNPYNIGIPFIWCSNNLLTSLITQIILYEKMTGDSSYHNFMLEQRDWLFGRNPWGTSMFTGIPEGGEYPEDIHTGIWALTREEVPGGLVNGPVYQSIFESLQGPSLLEPDEFAEVQNNYVVYHDDIGDYSTNEPTMDGTAGSTIMAAYFASLENSPGNSVSGK